MVQFIIYAINLVKIFTKSHKLQEIHILFPDTIELYPLDVQKSSLLILELIVVQLGYNQSNFAYILMFSQPWPKEAGDRCRSDHNERH